MLGLFVASVTDTTVPVQDFVPDTQSTASGVIQSMWDNLGANGYQTGIAVVVATIAVVAMINIGVHRLVLIPVGIGAFWAGWLAWNTFTGQSNPLFPGDVSATKLWDVGFKSDTGFLLVVIVASVAALFLWRKGTALGGRLILLAGAVLGASFLYNLFEAVRYS